MPDYRADDRHDLLCGGQGYQFSEHSAYGSVVSFKAADRTFTKHSIPARPFCGSMPMMSMEMETPIPLEMEVRFPHGSTNQVRESPLTRRVLGSQPFTNQHPSGPPAVRFDGINDVLNLTPIRSTAGGYSVYVATCVMILLVIPMLTL